MSLQKYKKMYHKSVHPQKFNFILYLGFDFVETAHVRQCSNGFDTVLT